MIGNTKDIIEIEREIIKDAKLEQFENFIDNIKENVRIYSSMMDCINKSFKKSSSGYEVKNTALGLIFDYDLCNEYAKIIIDKTDIEISYGISGRRELWEERYYNIKKFKKLEERVRVAKSLIKYCEYTESKREKYMFIFWSLLILTVDKNRVEEHLSLICDFAKLLNITNDEFEDIIYVIKNIYNDGDGKYIFKTELIPDIFNAILNLENKLI